MNTWLIAQRDLGAYLQGWSGYLIIALTLLVNGVLFIVIGLGGSAKYSHEVLEQFFYNTAGTTMIAAVLLTMRSIADERQSGTDVIYLTSPVNDREVVIGKWLAAMGVLTLMTLLTVYMPALIFVNGKVAISHIAVGYVGLLCLGGASAAVGILGSAMFRNQVVCAIASGTMVVFLLILWLVSDMTDPPFTDVMAYGAFFQKHFMPFQEGRLLTTGLVYYATVTFGFLTLATKLMSGRRWQ
jgi:ABC-2 type transport system permease protein